MTNYSLDHDVAEIRYSALPSISKFYARAALGAVKKRRPRAPVLPAQRVVVDNATVDAESLTDFQHVVRARASDVIPVSYLHAMGFSLALRVMVDDAFPLSPMGMVHLDNVVTQHFPVSLGEPLSLKAWAEDLAEHRRGTTVVLRLEVSTADGRVAMTEASTYLAKSVYLFGRPGDSAGAADPVAPPREEFAAPPQTGLWAFTSGDAKDYARVSGDANPIHLSTLAAKAFGFPGVIAHGMYSAARALAAEDPREMSFTWRASFGSPVVLPARITVGVRETSGGGSEVVGWNGKRNRPHFFSSVEPVSQPG